MKNRLQEFLEHIESCERALGWGMATEESISKAYQKGELNIDEVHQLYKELDVYANTHNYA